MSPRWIVVGAGSAGSVVAASLSQDPTNEVLLLEAGDDRDANNRPGSVSSLDWSGGLADPDLWWLGPSVRRVSGGQAQQYMRGLGVGGTSAVNGMLSLPGLPSDYERWEQSHGCAGWSWEHVAPDFARLRDTCRPAAPSEMRPIDRVLEGATRDLGVAVGVDLWDHDDGAGPAWLSATYYRRLSSAESWIDGARSRSNLIVRPHAEVEQVIMVGDDARGVRLMSGENLASDYVVLCAGALGSPAILMRSGTDRQGLGKNLCEHPSLRLGVRLQDPPGKRAASPPIVTMIRLSSSVGRGDIHVLPFCPSGDNGMAHVLVGCMTTTSRGWMELDPTDPAGPPRVQTNELATDHDRVVLHDAHRWLDRVVATPTFSSAVVDVGEVVVGGELYHAAGTCRMGATYDPSSVVDTSGRVIGLNNVYVIDASILPELPAAGPHLTVVMVAARLARRLAQR